MVCDLPVSSAGAQLHTAAPSPPRGFVRLFRAGLVGSVVAGTVAVARVSETLTGPVAVAAFVALLLAIPVSRQLSRRIALVGCSYLGWVQVLYWWNLPIGSVGRNTLVFALLAGSLAGWMVHGQSPRARLRRLMPRIRVVDGLPLLGGAVSLVVLWDWLRPKSGSSTLAMLTWGDDHVAHFAMVRSIRLNGVTSNVLPPLQGGDTGLFDAYPQAFHAVIADVMELMTSVTPGGAEIELLNYARAVGLVLVALVVVVCAVICASPWLRGRPLIAAPLIALITATFVVGPGSSALHQGFPNFVFACALVASICGLVVHVAEPVNPTMIVAIGGALVGVAHSWLLLLTLAGPLLLTLLVSSHGRGRSFSTRNLVLSGVLTVAVASGCVYALYIVASVPVSALSAAGGIGIPDLGPTLAFPLAATVVCLLVGSRTAQDGCGSGSTRRRARWLLVVPVSGLLTAGALAALQLSTEGELSYYFWKYVIGLQIVSAVILALGIAAYLGARSGPQRRRGPAVLAAIALTLITSQAFGTTLPVLTASGPAPSAPVVAHLQGTALRIADPPAATVFVSVVDGLVAEHPGQRLLYVSVPSDGRTLPYVMSQWSLALTGAWTVESQRAVVDLHLDESDSWSPTLESMISGITRVLGADPETLIVVHPEVVEQVRALMSDRELGNRVVSW